MGLELLAISMGLSTFARFLQGQCVIVYCDNKGTEVTVFSMFIKLDCKIYVSVDGRQTGFDP
eukprot:3138505-Karenia_brevis.AAC.1